MIYNIIWIQMYNIVIQYIHTLQNDHQDKFLSPCTIIISSSLLKVGTICCFIPKLCPTLCDPMYHSLPGSSLHGILQARILEWVAISFSRGSSKPKDPTCVCCTGKQTLYLFRPLYSLAGLTRWHLW